MPLKTKKIEETKKVETKEHGKILISWLFNEYPEYERSSAWFFTFGLIVCLFIVYSIIVKNFLFGVIIVMFALIILLHSSKPPLKVKINLTEDGLELGDKFYPYKDLAKFWIIYEPPEIKNLYISFKSGLRPKMIIPLEKADPVKIRGVLLEHLHEDLDRTEESLSEYLGRKLKI